MNPFEYFRRHHTSGIFVPIATKKIILPHAHILQEYLKIPNILKILFFEKIPEI